MIITLSLCLRAPQNKSSRLPYPRYPLFALFFLLFVVVPLDDAAVAVVLVVFLLFFIVSLDDDDVVVVVVVVVVVLVEVPICALTSATMSLSIGVVNASPCKKGRSTYKTSSGISKVLRCSRDA